MNKLFSVFIGFLLSFNIALASPKNIPILEYHHVTSIDSNVPADEMAIGIESFEKEMEWLYKNGYKTITAAQLAAYMDDPSSLNLKENDKIIVISFDDGYTDQLNAQYILGKYGFVATFNVISSKPGVSHEYMTWDQINNLIKSGHEIGSHTVSHMKQMGTEDMYKEIIKSKNDIEQNINQPVKIIAWPNGYFTKDMIKLALQANYIGALTIDQDWCQYNNTSIEGTLSCQKITGNNAFQNPFLMKRIFIDGRCSVEKFAEMVQKGHTVACVSPTE